jgi:hypothetical protein
MTRADRLSVASTLVVLPGTRGGKRMAPIPRCDRIIEGATR